MNRQIKPYGTWTSSISAAMVARSGSGHSALPRELQADLTGVYWIEAMPEQAGRYVIQHLVPGASKTVITPEDFSVRTRVHEYGGGSYLLSEGTIYFSHESDQKLYRQAPGKPPRPISPEPPNGEDIRYADGCITPDGSSLIYVAEHHGLEGQVDNYLVLLSSSGERNPQTLHSGHDFYANPRMSPDGQQLLWLTWELPRMPWEGTDLWMADFVNDNLQNVRHIAGGEAVSIYQPEWGMNGQIYFVSDQSGWWNIYAWNNGQILPLTPLEIDFGLPLWSLGSRMYVLLHDHRIASLYIQQGKPGLALIEIDPGAFDLVDFEYNFAGGAIAAGHDEGVWFLAGSPIAFPGLSRLDLKDLSIKRIAEVRENNLPSDYISNAEHFSFETSPGNLSYAYFYPPTHPEYKAPDRELPPLIVLGHGGPTSAARPYLNLEIQYWTSRGFAVVDVDYSGSTGYGRAYRDRLKGEWGVIDVADCVKAARHLVNERRVDPQRLLISGGSAGGYIVLRALTEYDDFAAGASYYGVADLTSFMQDTHKFEAGYDEYLVGPYPQSEAEYIERSPVNHADKIGCPVILFQGLDDKIVPPSQSEILITALERNNIPYKYITFEGEGHGFRQAENIETALEAELSFYLEVLNILAP